MTRKDRRQRELLCKDFVRMYCKCQEVDAITVTCKLREWWGVDIDWHEMTNALESMEQHQGVERTGTSGERMAVYLVK